MVKFIDIKEFREFGYLQELNRQFLHPMGLALAVEVDEDGNESIEGIWDYRDDPEGMAFDESMRSTEEWKEKVKRVKEAFEEKKEARIEGLGYFIQPE